MDNSSSICPWQFSPGDNNELTSPDKPNMEETDKTVCPSIVLSRASTRSKHSNAEEPSQPEKHRADTADTLILEENKSDKSSVNSKKTFGKKLYNLLSLPSSLKQRSVPLYSSSQTASAASSWMNFAAEGGFMELARQRDREAVKFLRESFYAKECNDFVARVGDKGAGPFYQNQRCFCGGTHEDHENKDHLETVPEVDETDDENVGNSNEKEETDHKIWDKQAIRKLPTNAYGRINFYPKDLGYQKPAKYLRLSNDTNMCKVIELLVRFWNLTAYTGPPELVISVIGGGKQFRISDSRKKDIFSRGIIRSIKTTRGWLITSGLHCGVAKAVGDAVKEGQTLEWYENGEVRRTITCIGIAPWGVVLNRNDLVNSDVEKLEKVSYFVDPCVRRWQPVSLNQHHSHFLLVDDGYRNTEKGVAHFRATFERMIAAPQEEGGLGVPVVCLLVEGGANCLDQLIESVTHGSPVLICEGTGRVADLLAESIRKYKSILQIQDTDRQEQEVEEMKLNIEETLAQFYSHARTSVGGDYGWMADKMITLCKHHDMISIFALESQSDLDLAILSVLMERREMDLVSQLKLAFRWNRPDVAAAKIVGDPGFYIKDAELYRLLEEALVLDMPEFVRLFINQGVSMNRFLTVYQLRTLYNDTVDSDNHIWYLMKRNKSKRTGITLSDVYSLIKSFTRRFHHNLYSCDTEENADKNSSKSFDYPFQELFLWSVLLNRQSMALLFWEHCVDPLVISIVGTLICQCLADKIEDFSSELAPDFLHFKEQLQFLAIGLVNQTYDANRQKSILLIHKPNRTWGDLNSLELAGLAGDQDFLACTCCQSAIFDKWKNGFEANGLEIFISTILIFPIFCVVNFDEDQIPSDNRARSANARTRKKTPGIVATPLLPATKRYYSEQVSCGSTDAYAVKKRPSVVTPAPLRRTKTAGTIAIAAVPLRPAFKKQTSLVAARAENINVNRAHGSLDLPWIPKSELKCPTLPCWEKIVKFYRSPIVKFTNHTIWYLAYLFLYAYVVLFSLKPHKIEFPEMFLYFWQFTFILEAIRTLFLTPAESIPTKVIDWFVSYVWKMDVVVSILSILGFIFRFTHTTFALARLILVLNLVLYIIRLLRAHFANSYLGPKVIMVKRMSWDLAMFLLVAVVFMASYSVAYLALVRTDRPHFYWGIFWELYVSGIWELFGEPSEKAMEGVVPDCPNPPVNGTWSMECALRIFPIPLLLSGYLFFGNILLVNMLIAIFAHVFDEIQAKSEQVWKFQMYFLVEEYTQKPVLPAPLIVFHHLYYLLKFIYTLLTKPCVTEKKKKTLILCGQEINDKDLEFLEIYERCSRADFTENRKRIEAGKLENVVNQLQDNVNKLFERVSQTERLQVTGGYSMQSAPDSGATSMMSLQPAIEIN